MSKKAAFGGAPAGARPFPSPGLADILPKALALIQQGRLDEARSALRKVLKQNPKLFDALHLSGLIELQSKNFKAAERLIGQASKVEPRSAQAHANLGNALCGLGRHEEAITHYDRALALEPGQPVFSFNRGNALLQIGRHDEARASLDRALELNPQFIQASFARCMAELPIVYASESEITERRTAYERRLRELCGLGAELARGVGSSQPFYLAYQGRNDRDLQALYGAMICKVAGERFPRADLAPAPGAGEPLRVGVVSGFFRNHANWRLPIKGWLSRLDRRRFRMFGYHTGEEQDGETRLAKSLCDRFVAGPLSISGWRSEILSDAPHVLIYPEIGMDPVSIGLAAQRLAAVQCNSWGHPETSGLPTLDYFISSERMEPPEGQDHYTEKLVRLPNLSVYLEPVARPAKSCARRDFGLRSSATLYWCGQSLYKFLPQYDEVFPRIALAAGDCQFVFIQYRTGSHVTETFRRRLQAAFAAKGLRFDDHCVFLPRLKQDEFIAATGLGDVYLDSPGWSGCNSTVESLLHDMPIVTLPGELMRARHSMAMLDMMDVRDTIAETIDDYIAIAARLASDKAWRMAIKAKISANKHRIYRDDAPISALEQFLDRVARHPGGTPR